MRSGKTRKKVYNSRMQNFIVAFNAVFPVTVMIFIGVFLRRANYIQEDAFKQFNWLIFHICLPITLFLNISDADLDVISDFKLLAFVFITLFAIAGLAVFTFKFIPLSNQKKGVVVQDFTRTNFVVLGLPIAQSIYGPENIGLTSFLIAWVVPVSNLVGVLILQLYSDKHLNLRGTIINILKNPLIVGALLGVAFQLLNLQLPTAFHSTLKMLNQISTPLALIVLGGLFQFSSLKENAKILTYFSIVKMFILPAIVVLLAILFGFRDVALVSILILFGGPAAVTSYSMAVQMGADGDLAAQIILVTTILVLFSLILFLTILGAYGFI